ncbi:hypothetical protein KCU83_g429, partial [Aureobasidium melanogenum]
MSQSFDLSPSRKTSSSLRRRHCCWSWSFSLLSLLPSPLREPGREVRPSAVTRLRRAPDVPREWLVRGSLQVRRRIKEGENCQLQVETDQSLLCAKLLGCAQEKIWMDERAGDGRAEAQQLLQRLEEIFEAVSFAMVEAIDNCLRKAVIFEEMFFYLCSLFLQPRHR